MPAKSKKSESFNFEENLDRLTDITDLIGDVQTSLDEAISMYKEGIILAKTCGEALQRCEQEVALLQKDSDKFILEPFAAEVL